MTPPVKMLVIYVDDTDMWNNLPLYEALVRRMKQAGIAGATVHHGTMGFGLHGNVHHKGLFGISDDRPVTVTAIDNEFKLREILPELRGMVVEGLVVLLDAEVIPPS